MRFFEEQARARRRTALLVVLFAASIGLTVLVMDVVFGLSFGIVQWIGLDLGNPITQGLDTKRAPGEAMWQMLVRTWQFLVPRWLIWAISIAVLCVIAIGTVRRMRELAEGGPAVAQLLFAKPVVRVRADPLERRLLNVVEEMSLAAGLPVPRVYVLDSAGGVNALTAGFTPGDAAIIVTRGALVALERDELQGVVAHEISHVLNGDVRLNTWLIGLLAGIVSVGALGGYLLGGGKAEVEPGEVNYLMARASLGLPFALLGGVALYVVGLALLILGGAGLVFARLIKATISREREFLADASAVRFTRNPEGLAGALARIEGHRYGSRLYHPQAEALSHMFFSASVLVRLEWLFATHPPIEERIARIAPSLHAELYLQRRPSRTEAEMIEDAIREAQERSPHEGAVALAGAETVPQAVVDSVGNPAPEHTRYAAALLDSLPTSLREALATAKGSQAVLLALAVAPEGAAREQQLATLERVDPRLASMTRQSAAQIPALGTEYRLPIVELAIPSLALLGPAERRVFLGELRHVVDADGRLTPREFVLFVLLNEALHHRPRRVRERFRTLAEIPGDAQRVLALLAAAAPEDAAKSFRDSLAVAGLKDAPMPDAANFSLDQVLGSLARLNRVAPLAKPALIKGCVAAVRGTVGIRAQEAELVRTVGVAIDCPLPPLAIRAQ
jgi:Zn-dependent protease with chaperone function